MSFTIRRCERYTNWEATEPVSLNPEDFRDISFPFKGDGEEAFLRYIQSLEGSAPVVWYSIAEELKSRDRVDACDALTNLFEGDMSLYSSTTDKYGDFWLDSGEVNEDYRKWGGFKVNHTTRG